MLRKIAVFALAASVFAGCEIVVRPGATVEVQAHMEPHGHAYIYLPGYHAYYCTAHDDWWWIDGGYWSYRKTRPSHIHVDVNVAWVHVDDDDGPEPYRRFDDHCRNYPQDWRSTRHEASPSRRGWGPPDVPVRGSRGQGDARGRDRDANQGRDSGRDQDRDARRDEGRDDDRRDGSPVPGGGGTSRGRAGEGSDRRGRDGSEGGEGHAEGDRSPSGKDSGPPKEKDASAEKDRGRDKEKDKSKGKGKDGGEPKKKDVEKEKDKEKDVEKEQGGDEDEDSKKERGPKKRGD